MKPTDEPPPYPMPQPSYPMPQPQIFVVETKPAVGPDPFHIVCPNCRSDVYSRVERDTAATGYICCGLLFIVGCFCCSCIPLFMDSFQRVDHFCPSCGHFFGTYKP